MEDIEISTERSEVERDALVARRVRYEGISAVDCVDCVDCEDPIPEKRRQAIAGCQRCVDCQEIHDQRNRR